MMTDRIIIHTSREAGLKDGLVREYRGDVGLNEGD
jgi:hypothetical protein